MSQLGWAVVGTGDVSRSIASDLRLLDPSGLAAACSRSVERASEFASDFGFASAHGSIDSLLLDDAVDIVYIGTPHATHAELAVRALEAGKHVLIEKPLGVTAADVERVALAAHAAGRFAMEGMWMKFNPAYRGLVSDVRDGVIGEPTAVRAYFGLPFGDRDSIRWSGTRSSSTLLDQGIYPVTAALDVFGEPTSITATADLRDDGVDVSIEATLGFAGGGFAHIAASMVGYLEPTASVSGTGGWMSLAAPFWATDRFSRHTGDLGHALMQPESVQFAREGNGYVPMLRAVTDAITAGLTEHPLHPLSSSIAVARVLDSIRATRVAHTLTETAP